HLLLLQTWWPQKFGGALAANDYFHVSWSLSVECCLYLVFGLCAIAAAFLPVWRYKRVIVSVLLLVAGWLAMWAWLELRFLRPNDWTDADLSRWLFQYSPYGIALQFGIGVASYEIGKRLQSARIARIASELGGAGLILVYLYKCLSKDLSAF